MNPAKEEHDIVSEDGIASKITLFKGPKQKTPTIICMPAMGVCASFYEPLAQELVNAGFNAVTGDLRGLGHSVVKPSKSVDFGYHEMVSFDWPAIVNKTKSLFPENPVFLLGHSMGGQINALYAGASGNKVDGMILVASGSVYYKNWPFPKNIVVLAGTRIAKLLANRLGYFPGHRVGFGGKGAKTVISDWADSALTGRYEIAGSPHDFEALLEKVSIPILAVSIKGDDFAPPKSTHHLCRKMKQASTTYRQIQKNRDASHQLDHVNWVKHSQPIAIMIKKWVNRVKA